VVSQIINNNHILNFSIFHHLFKNFLIKILIFIHSYFSISPTNIITINKCSLNCIIFIHMFKTDSLTNRWFIMDSLTTITIPTSTHLIKKWTVNFIHLGSIDFC
jgi:hypothetical protein